MCGNIADDPSMHDFVREELRETGMPLDNMKAALDQMIDYIVEENLIVSEIHVVKDRHNRDGWKAYMILSDEKPFKYAWYFGTEYPPIADGY